MKIRVGKFFNSSSGKEAWGVLQAGFGEFNRLLSCLLGRRQVYGTGMGMDVSRYDQSQRDTNQ
jgi:hypothetical protein